MKKIFFLTLLILFYSSSVFGGVFEDTLKKAKQGDATAQYDLGVMYVYGKEVDFDEKQALYWYKKAAEQGNVKAQYTMGCVYENGSMAEQDYSQAFYWYKKAALQGEDRAYSILGRKYFYGQGVQKDFKQAIYWYTKVAEQGNADAQFALGEIYGKEGALYDHDQSYYWYTKAAKQGNIDAERFLGWNILELPKEVKNRMLSVKNAILSKNIDQLYNGLEDGILDVFPSGPMRYSITWHGSSSHAIKSKEDLKNNFDRIFNQSFIETISIIKTTDFLKTSDFRSGDDSWCLHWELRNGLYNMVFDSDGSLLMVRNGTAVMPSFDCTKASNRVEKLICKDKSLADRDKDLASKYSYARRTLTGVEAKALKSNQLAFIKKRNDLVNNIDSESKWNDLILQFMDTRIKELNALIENESKKTVRSVPIEEGLKLIQGQWSTTDYMNSGNISSGSTDAYLDAFVSSPFTVLIKKDKIIVTKSTKKRVLENIIHSGDVFIEDYIRYTDSNTECKIIEVFQLPLAIWLDLDANHPRHGSAGGGIWKFDMLSDVYAFKLEPSCPLEFSYFIYTQNHKGEGKAFLAKMIEVEETNKNNVEIDKLLPDDIFFVEKE